MSRQVKLRKKKTMALDATFDHNEKGERVGGRHKGPKRTTPKHGKVKRLPYDAEFRQKHFHLPDRHDRNGNLVY